MMMRRYICAALAICAAPALAEDAGKAPSFTIRDLGQHSYIVEGGTSNAAFIVGDKGVILIDAQRTEPEAKAEMKLISSVTQKPITTAILTHSDPDHIGGLPAYPGKLTVIAQENTKATIVASAADAANGGPFFGPIYTRIANGYLPTTTVAGDENVTIDGVRMQFFHAFAHSSGDLFVYLPDRKIVFAGDIVLTDKGRFPIIHLGGSSLGWIEAMRTILALDADVIVPGHGPVESAAQLRGRLADAEKRRADIKAMIDAGKSWKDIAAALPEQTEVPVFPSYTWTTYQELIRGYPEAVPPWANMQVRKEQDAASANPAN